MPPLPSTPCNELYYLDTNALWKYYHGQKGDRNVRRLVAGSSFQVLVSPLTVVEFIGVLMRHHRCKRIKRKDVNAVVKRLRRDIATVNVHRPFRMVDLPDAFFREAQGILLQYAGEYAIQTNDALHLAIAIRLSRQPALPIVFVTSDGALQHAAQRNGLGCYDPEPSRSALRPNVQL